MVKQISFIFKPANKSKGVCEVAIAEVIAKGILVSCKGERSSGFAKEKGVLVLQRLKYKSRGSLTEPVAEIVTTRIATIVRGNLKLYKFYCSVVSFDLHSECSFTG